MLTSFFDIFALKQTEADADAYQVVAGAQAAAKSVQIAAEAQAEATRLAARADADAIRIRAAADAEILDVFAREMQLRRIDVQRVAAYGDRTVFVPTGNGAGADVSGSIAGSVLGAASAAVGIASMK